MDWVRSIRSAGESITVRKLCKYTNSKALSCGRF